MDTLFPKNCVLIFSKAPEPGKVKTRLAGRISASQCAILHERLVVHTIRMVTQSAVAPAELWCAPDKYYEFFVRQREMFELPLLDQGQGDLGVRMSNALTHALGRYRFAVIVGTDCPVIDKDYLQAAFEKLANGVDVVLGPAEDGGYVLLGLGKVDPMLFENIPWGTSGVFETTCQRLNSLGWKWHELPVKWDVDRPEDLERLQRSDFSYLTEKL